MARTCGGSTRAALCEAGRGLGLAQSWSGAGSFILTLQEGDTIVGGWVGEAGSTALSSTSVSL